jgi:hypothetical protein
MTRVGIVALALILSAAARHKIKASIRDYFLMRA